MKGVSESDYKSAYRAAVRLVDGWTVRLRGCDVCGTGPSMAASWYTESGGSAVRSHVIAMDVGCLNCGRRVEWEEPVGLGIARFRMVGGCA